MKTEMTYKLSTPSNGFKFGPLFTHPLSFDGLMKEVEELIRDKGMGYLKQCRIYDAKEGCVLGIAYSVTFVTDKTKGNRIEFAID